jgi:DNA-binding response OmpR family regulator
VNIREGSQIRVLFVDDCVDTADSQALIAGMWGYESRACYDGDAALKTGARFLPHVVFIDLSLPDMDGYEIARRLQSQHRSQSVLLVAIRGWDFDLVRQRVLEAGFAHYFVKGGDPDQLRDLLRRVASQDTSAAQQDRLASCDAWDADKVLQLVN